MRDHATSRGFIRGFPPGKPMQSHLLARLAARPPRGERGQAVGVLPRWIADIFLPRATSSTNRSRYRIFCINGSSIS
jgi:hypothetical protein